MKNIAQQIGREVKNARKNKKLTQQDISEKINISRNYLSDIECGRYTPSVETLISLAKILSIDLNSLKNDGNTI